MWVTVPPKLFSNHATTFSVAASVSMGSLVTVTAVYSLANLSRLEMLFRWMAEEPPMMGMTSTSRT